MTRTTIGLGTLLVLLGASMIVTAYHVEYDGNDYGDGAFIADEWVNPDHEGKTVVLCESTGQDDKINPGFPGQQRGDGGLCYANSQDFTMCALDTDPVYGALPYTLKTGPNALCDSDKEDWKDKKPFQNATHTDWGYVQPKCTGALDPDDNGVDPNGPLPPLPGGCLPGGDQFVPGDHMEEKPSEGDPLGSNPLNPLGLALGDWFIRIGDNSRSCTGEWGQAFAYKEIVAYYAGAGPNSNKTAAGVSGHVTFFVSEENVVGGYDRQKEFGENPIKSSNANMLKSFGDKDPNTDDDDNCTGDGNNWGLVDEGIPKSDPPA